MTERIAQAPIADASTLHAARRWLTIAALVLLSAAALRLFVNERAQHALALHTQQSLQRTVAVTSPRAANDARVVSLPATLRGAEEAVIYARTTGYVAAWRKTIGDVVRKGDLLAQLSAPEQEQELLQARAAREQIRVRVALSRDSLARWQTQLQANVVSRHAFEEKRAE